LFFYTQKSSIISMVDLPTTDIIEPKKEALSDFLPVYSTVSAGRDLRAISARIWSTNSATD
ncbi:hypothetical protein EJA00_09245, partial [Streptococcus suis]